VHLFSLPLVPELPEHAPEVGVLPPSSSQVDVVDLAASALVTNGATATAIATLVTAIAGEEIEETRRRDALARRRVV
jgi:hypothetical protein